MAIPMKLSAAERTRPTLWDGLLALLVLACAGVLFWSFRPVSSDFLTATIVLDGVEVGSYALSEIETPHTFAVDAPWPLEVTLEHKRIRVSHSDCGSQDCVRTGWIDLSGQQIICLPNRLVISLHGGSEPDFDAISG